MGQPAGQLAQGNVQFARIGGVDHAQDGFSLAEVDASGEKGRRVNSPGLANRAPALQSDCSRSSNNGGEPIVWISTSGWPV